jgi:Tfp pilus assembly protein PilX
MRGRRMIDNERGIALVVVLLVVVAVAAIIAGSALLSSSTSLIARHEARLGVLETAADAGLEEARSRINGDRTQYPNSSFVSLEAGGTVYAADGSVIPNVRRWLYVGPSGVTTGQYGVFGSILSVTQDAQGDRVVRRSEVNQESFAKYAYFTTAEKNIQFANGDQIFGPVFSDDNINIASSGAIFNGPVATAKTVVGKAFGVYKQGLTEGAPVIQMPTTSDLLKLKGQAAVGGTAIFSPTLGTEGDGQATTRIEFVAVDVNGDGDSSDDGEGFMKVYQLTNPADIWWVVGDARTPSQQKGDSTGVLTSANCGLFTTGAGQKSTRCYLGGSDSLNNPKGFPPAGADAHGHWLPWIGPVDPRLPAIRADANYLWPINRATNPNFRGVVYVDGRVALSGKLRGRLTLAASGSIIIADDLRYVTNPGAANCADILGLFSGVDIVVADNLVNDPVPGTGNAPGPRSWDETRDTWLDGFVLALGSFRAENFNKGSTNAELCGTTKTGAPNPSGRGCLFVSGGVIQTSRGAVGLTTGEGYVKRYSYDQCGASNPPPYFPTTGHFARGHYYEVDPTGFNVTDYWSLLVPH